MLKRCTLCQPERLENKKLLSILNDYWNSKTALIRPLAKDQSVVVGIIDSGIDLTHKDLKDHLWVNRGEIPNDGIDNEGNGYVDDIHGWNFIDNNNNIQDNYGHGTHVAGIIESAGINILPIKFMDDRGRGSIGGAIKAIDYLLKLKNNYGVNVAVVNTSWGSHTGFSSVVYEKIQKLNEAGIILTASAGNSASNNDTLPIYPSCYNVDNVISVGALNYNETGLSEFSNYGANTVDLLAPGSMIYSTLPWNSYGYLSGSSMASPFVAGTVALLKTLKPTIGVAEAKAAVFGNVDRVPELFGKVSTNGKLNIEKTLSSIVDNKVPVGKINYQTLKEIGGWAKDIDNNKPINIQLYINNNLVHSGVTSITGSFVFNLGGLVVGEHVIKVKGQDVQTGSWVDIDSTKVIIRAPIVKVGLLSTSRIAGWAFSERSGRYAVMVRILINDKLVASQWANQYRPALRSVVGSMYHGFNMSLNRSWFRVGSNVIKVQVFDPISKQVSLVNQYTVIR